MRIAVVGTGYVGLVTGTCLADSGNVVTCLDIDEAKVRSLRDGIIPIFEPGLAEMVQRNAAAGRLTFSTEVSEAVPQAEVIFLAIGTPQSDDGSADLSALWSVVEQIAPHLRVDAVVVTKSTVPVGTNAKIAERLLELTHRSCEVASNPEFLKEGAAIDDFTKPDRVVVGVRRGESAEVLRRLYAPFLRTDRPLLVMSPESAELTKYVANALLATKISFINQMANVCEEFDADINDVRRGIGHDRRIGFAFLFPGVGYGGSCFPKDVRAMISLCRQAGIDPKILEAVDWVNEQQKHVLMTKLERHFKNELTQKTVAVWGLAFKPRTDDIREAPALVLIDQLISAGVRVRVHDPVAMDNVRAVYGSRLQYATHPMDALNNADALAITTEWAEFRTPDFAQMRKCMARPVLFDGRNLYDPTQMREEGFYYYSIGRSPVRPASDAAAHHPHDSTHS